MSFYSWKKILFSGSGRFDPSPAAERIPSIVIREITPDDLEVCHGIYRDNEAVHLPKGYFQHFEQDLVSDAYLWLVIEEAGIPIGVGGIHIEANDGSIASLAFGVVRPDKHGKGYGSALLLARVAALPAPDPQFRVVMSSVDNSVNFYKRFGFIFVKRIPMENGTELDWYYTKLTRPVWEASRIILASRQVSFDPEAVSVPNRPLRDEPEI